MTFSIITKAGKPLQSGFETKAQAWDFADAEVGCEYSIVEETAEMLHLLKRHAEESNEYIFGKAAHDMEVYLIERRILKAIPA